MKLNLRELLRAWWLGRAARVPLAPSAAKYWGARHLEREHWLFESIPGSLVQLPIASTDPQAVLDHLTTMGASGEFYAVMEFDNDEYDNIVGLAITMQTAASHARQWGAI